MIAAFFIKPKSHDFGYFLYTFGTWFVANHTAGSAAM